MKKVFFAAALFAWFAVLVLAAPAARAQGTAFSYEGQLATTNGPAGGVYDFTFTLYGANTGGAAVAGPVTNNATGVTNGLFTATIDFGPGVFNGADYWLEIGVRTNGGAVFTTLAPRQPLLPVPYAIFAGSAASLSGTLPASQISGTVPLTQIPAGVITNGETGVNFNGTFSGNGLGLTNVPVNSLAWTTNYPIVSWGDNDFGEALVPAGVSNVQAVASGYAHTLALQRDGTVVAWGENTVGDTVIPAGLSNVVAVAAGVYHSLALKSNGTVAAWGDNTNGQATAPAGLSNVVAVAAGGFHSLALKNNGTVTVWGYDYQGQTNVPAGLTNVTAVAGGYLYSVALKGNGTVAAWGDNTYGQTKVPVGLTNVTAIAAGATHVLALKSNGTVVAWGDNTYGQTNVPAGLTNVIAVAAGANHSLALTRAGTVLAWGGNDYGQLDVPPGLSNVVALATGCMAYDVLVIQQQAVSPLAALLSAGNNIFEGNLQIGGTISAVYFSGGGGGLTELNASALNSGTVPLALLPSQVLTNGASGVALSGTLTGNVNGSATTATTAATAVTAVTATTALVADNVAAGIAITNAFITNSVFAGDGSGLTNVRVNAANVTGALSAAQLPAGLLTNGASGVILAGTLTGNITGSAATATTAGVAAGVVAGIGITNAFITNSVFAGNGSGLTNVRVSAGNVTGVLTAAQLPPGILTNGASGVILSGTLTGNVTGNVTGNATTAASAGTASNLVAGILITNAFITNSVFAGNGAGLVNVSVSAANVTGALNPAQLPAGVLTNGATGVTLSGTLAGNATSAGTAGNLSPGVAITNAFITNSVFAGNGGGLFNLNAFQITAGFLSPGVLPGFQFPYDTVAGGQSNEVAGSYATVPGGFGNLAAGDYSFAAGADALATNTGSFVWADASGSPFADASSNTFNVRATGGVVFVTAGAGLTVDGQPVLTGAGAASLTADQNFSGANTFNNSDNSFSGDGSGLVNLNASALEGTVSPEQLPGNLVYNSGPNVVNLNGNFTGTLTGNADTATEAFGLEPGISVTNEFVTNSVFAGDGGGLANLNASALAGGIVPNSVLAGFQAPYNTVGGGTGNVAASIGATVGGGQNNAAVSYNTTIAGGIDNIATNDTATIGGGYSNIVSGIYTTVGGGQLNQASGSYATVPGGVGNVAAGQFSFAAGSGANAANDGSFVWSDGSTNTTSSANDQFLVRASGGVVLYSSAGTNAGVSLAAGSGTWASLSDRNAKNGFAAIPAQEVLDKVTALPITEWSYKTEHGVRHIGPMAQDFYAAFQVGQDDRHITTVDEEGVALAAIQGLNQKLDAKDATIQAQSAEIQTLKQQNDALAARLNELAAAVKALMDKR